MRAPVAVGDVIRIGEQHYCYGLGELRMRVTEVAPGSDRPDLEWIQLTGVEIRPDGTEASRPRTVLVRVAALRAYQEKRRRGGERDR